MMCARTHIRTYVCMYVHIYLSMCLRTCVCTCVRTSVRVCVCVYAYIYIYIYRHVFIFVDYIYIYHIYRDLWSGAIVDPKSSNWPSSCWLGLKFCGAIQTWMIIMFSWPWTMHWRSKPHFSPFPNQPVLYASVAKRFPPRLLLKFITSPRKPREAAYAGHILAHFLRRSILRPSLLSREAVRKVSKPK